MIYMSKYELGPCGSCTQVQECLVRLASAATFNHLFTEFAMGPELADHAGHLFETIGNLGMLEQMAHLDGAPIESSEDLVRVFRRSSAEILEQSDEKTEADEAFLKTLTTDCEGPLKMRATKAGRTITATVCNSPQAAVGVQQETVVIH